MENAGNSKRIVDNYWRSLNIVGHTVLGAEQCRWTSSVRLKNCRWYLRDGNMRNKAFNQTHYDAGVQSVFGELPVAEFRVGFFAWSCDVDCSDAERKIPGACWCLAGVQHKHRAVWTLFSTGLGRDAVGRQDYRLLYAGTNCAAYLFESLFQQHGSCYLPGSGQEISLVVDVVLPTTK